MAPAMNRCMKSKTDFKKKVKTEKFCIGTAKIPKTKQVFLTMNLLDANH
jgi:hypothetical protein